MNKFYIRNKSLIINLPLAAFIFVIAIFMFSLGMDPKKEINYLTLFTRFFAGETSIIYINTINWVMFLGLNLLYLYIFAGNFREELVIAYPYVFTRYGSKRSWLFKQFVNISKKIAVYVSSQIIIVAIVSIFFSEKININSDILYSLFITLVLHYLHMHFWTSLSNMLAVKLGDSVGITLALGSIAICLFLGRLVYLNNLPKILLYLLPTANLMYFWHTDSYTGVFAGEVSQITGFYLSGSILALLVMILLIYLIFMYLLEKQDSIELIGG